MTANLQPDKHFSGSELRVVRAAMDGRADEVRRLIEGEGLDPNATSATGHPLILWPMIAGNSAGVEALLDSGADPNLPIPELGTLMALAARAEDPTILGAFLDHGGDGDTKVHGHEPLVLVAALNGKWENVKLLAEHGADINASAGEGSRRTVLSYYSSGQFEKVHWLLERGADPGFRVEQAHAPERVGAQPIVEEIYWWPIDPERFPEGARWQERCQEFLAERGYERPPEPQWIRNLRKTQEGSGQAEEEPQDLDAAVTDAEERLRRRLQE